MFHFPDDLCAKWGVNNELIIEKMVQLRMYVVIIIYLFCFVVHKREKQGKCCPER